MMIKDVNVSASGIANQIPHIFRIKGKPNIHIIMDTNPRKTVTVMAGRACSTLLKFPMETIFMAKNMNPKAKSGNPDTAMPYAA